MKKRAVAAMLFLLVLLLGVSISSADKSFCIMMSGLCDDFTLAYNPANGRLEGTSDNCGLAPYAVVGQVFSNYWILYLDWAGQGFPPSCGAGDFAWITGGWRNIILHYYINCVEYTWSDNALAACGQQTCNGWCAAKTYMPCTCDPTDPCNWSDNGTCDRNPCNMLYGYSFDDGNDCVAAVDYSE